MLLVYSLFTPYQTSLARKNMCLFQSDATLPDFVIVTENDPVVPVL